MAYQIIRAPHLVRQLPLIALGSPNSVSCNLCSYQVKRAHFNYQKVILNPPPSLRQMMWACSVRPSYCAFYRSRADGVSTSRGMSTLPLLNKSNGLLSRKSGKRIRNAISWMLFFSRTKTVFSVKDNRRFTFLLSFVTLTLSEQQKHSDEEIKRHMLRPFLKWLERNGCGMFVWKAEAQANGNIHFHVTVNNFIHWKSIQKKWNKLQYSMGYKKAFKDGSRDKDANSTDVHSVRNAKQTAAYMAKYMSKNDKTRRMVTGKVWGCSNSLTNIKCTLDEHSPAQMDELINWIETNGTLLLSDEYMRVYTHEHLKFIKLPAILSSLTRSLIEERSSMIDCQKLLIEVDSFS